ncbi:G3E family GTPase [Bacillus ectoiniformans]|uniref:CobW family GTP-binding protein n=1 Tax=Bacillus ectoiniformans TaxID=1494429 RepID=UPI001958B353|nr:GTP-binding protein [Bacillus ectoiniformans]MBM7647836.1 G3E family GTPase [Bacillus ectoiniformans]
MDKSVEIYILAGFLGSGKSTLLKSLLMKEREEGRTVAVLMNELGEYSVDTGIIGTDVTLTELLNGCICCTMKDEVEIQLLTLYKQEQPDVIYIEATGVAHPIEILDACLSPVIAPFVQVKSIISVVDSKRWLDRTRLNRQLQKLLEEQIIHGDQILLNKSDCVSTEELAEIQKEVKGLNPRARIYTALFAEVPLSILVVNRDEQDIQSREELHVKKHLHIQTMTYSFHDPIERGSFESWLRAVPSNIFRVKGFIRFHDDDQTYLIQHSYGVPYLLPQPIKFPANLVIIGTELNKDQVKEELMTIEGVIN